MNLKFLTQLKKLLHRKEATKQGIIRSVNYEKGIGYVSSLDGFRELYIFSLKQSSPNLYPGARVCFEAVKNHRSPRAKNVRLVKRKLE